MQPVSRRALLPLLTLPVLNRARGAGRTVGLNAGTYGMKSMKLADALHAVAAIGFDGVEIALMPGWPTVEPGEIRRTLEATAMALPSLMESLSMDGSAENRARRMERLKLAIALAHELSPHRLPVIETVLGGKSAEWDQVKNRMADELGEWGRLAQDGRITICFKPHADQAIDMPERALWMLKQVANPRIRIIYDYSHFYVQGLTLEESLSALLPYTAYIAVKDSAGDRNRHQFLLPGEGKTDYAAYFRLLKEAGYSGFVGIEITSQIHSRPGYEPVPTLRVCYDRLAKAFQQAGLKRR